MRPGGRGSIQLGAVVEQHFSGPIPPPHLLQEYDAIQPGFAERIFAMTERQATHRQGIETSVINGNVRSQERGQWMAFGIAVLGVVGGVYLLATGRQIDGYAAIFTPIAGIVVAFIYNRREQSKERVGKDAANPK